jgi:hypothetical protein
VLCCQGNNFILCITHSLNIDVFVSSRKESDASDYTILLFKNKEVSC